MTQILLRKIAEKQIPNKRFAIINMASINGDFPFPYTSIYSGAKAFITVKKKNS